MVKIHIFLIFSLLDRLYLNLTRDDDIIIRLTNYEDIGNKIFAMRKRLKEMLNDDKFKNCLIVLGHVQNRDILKAFNLNCKIMITTRNKEVKLWIFL